MRKGRRYKKALSILLSAVLLISMGTTAFATVAGTENPTENVTEDLTENLAENLIEDNGVKKQDPEEYRLATLSNALLAEKHETSENETSGNETSETESCEDEEENEDYEELENDLEDGDYDEELLEEDRVSGATPSNAVSDFDSLEELENDISTPSNAERIDVLSDLQERIDALPAVEDFAEMSFEEQDSIYAEVMEISDIYYEGLTDEEQTQIDTEKLFALLSVFTNQIMTMAFAEDIAASVGETGYKSLSEACDAAANTGNPVVLQQDVEIDSSLSISGAVTIDLNGHELTQGSEPQMVFWVESGGDLTLTGTGSVSGTNYKFGIIYVASGGQATLEDQVVLKDNQCSYGGAVYNKGSFTMAGGTIQNTYASGGGGAVYNTGTFTMEDGSIQNTSSAYRGGAVYNTGTFTMESGTISGTKATTTAYNDAYGGGAVLNTGTFTMNGGMISDASASYGGAVHNSNVFSMTNGTISSCVSTSYGGGVYNSGTFTMEDGLIFGNKGSSGCGVYNDMQSEMRMDGGTIALNEGGGGIYASTRTKTTVTGGAVYKNVWTSTTSTYKGEYADYFGSKDGYAISSAADEPVEVSFPAADTMNADGYTFTGWNVYDLSTKITTKVTGELPGGWDDYPYGQNGYIVYWAECEEADAAYSSGIYLDGNSGDDALDGTSKDKAVKTFGRAEELAVAALNRGESAVIYVCGTVTAAGNEEWSLPEGVVLKREKDFKDYLIKVPKGAELTLRDITVDGSRPMVNGVYINNISGYTNSLIHVTDGGTLNISDGAILQNNLAGRDDKDYDGGAVFVDCGTVHMTGGIIQNNKSRNYGGGITITGSSFTSSTFTMSGGSIEDNESSSGGGAAILRGARMELGGEAVISSNHALSHGGGIHVGGDTTAECSGYGVQQLVMDGGRISENTANYSGGGIFIQHNSRADISSGDIVSNEAGVKGGGGHPFQGGGIYVNGGKYYLLNAVGEVANGLLQLYNVEITGNSANSGGGLAACPTANVSMFLTDGGIFHDNNTETGNSQEIFCYEASSQGNQFYTSDFMLGGGMYQWIYNGERAPQDYYQYTTDYVYLNNICAAEDVAAAQRLAQVHISGNKADQRGGGIASNGDVIIGSAPQNKDSAITITKTWNDNGHGEMRRPTSIKADIRYGEYTLRGIELTAENGWKATWQNMPDEIINQPGAELKILETDCAWYTLNEESGRAEVDDDGVLQISFENVYNPVTGTLTVTKTVGGNAGETQKEFHFTVTLNDKLIHGEYGDMTFTDGTAVFTLKHGESKTAVGLPADTVYEVVEAEAGQDGYITTSTGKSGVITEEGAAAAFLNVKNSSGPGPGPGPDPDPKPDPDPDPSTGSLIVSKTVSGSRGDTTKPFLFTVTLGDTSINGQYGDMDFHDGVAVFELKHGESRQASDLPAGLRYTVSESNHGGYTVTSSGETGIIEEGETAAVLFNNHRSGGGSGGSGSSGGSGDPGGSNPSGGSGGPGVSNESGASNESGGSNDAGESEISVHVTEESQPEIQHDNVPRTGDESNLLLWIVLMGISGVGLIVTSKILQWRDRRKS